MFFNTNLRARALKSSFIPFSSEHWEDVRDIYRMGLLTGNATFETEVPGLNDWLRKFYPHLLWITLLDQTVVGWAGLQPVSERKVYDGVAEVTIYIHPDHDGKGVGAALMTHLIGESEKAGIWSLYAAIFPENYASVRLHEKCGFRKIGYREKIARLNGNWRDTVLYERRSRVVGI